MHRPPKHNLVNNRYGKLLVLEMVPYGPARAYMAKCQCDCGKIVTNTPHNLFKGRCISCGCDRTKYHKTRGKNSKQSTGFGEISGQKWGHIKEKAKERGHEFNLEIEYAWDLFLQQDRKCALSGLLLEFGKSNSEPSTASLDRIDSNKGYTKDNIQWLHKDINKMKLTHSVDQFIEYCKLVVANSV